MESKKIFSLTVLLGFVAGLLGGGVTDLILVKGGMNVSAQPSTQQLVQNSYVEESQSIDAIKKASPSVVSIVASENLSAAQQSQPSIFFNGNPFNDPFFNFPGFQGTTQNDQGNSQGQNQDQNNNAQQNGNNGNQTQIGGGSGFIISADGLVLTNRHVVTQQGAQYTVVTSDGTEYDGEVVSIDPLYDLAVLQMVKKGEISKPKNQRTKLTNLPVIAFGDSSQLQVGQKVLAIGYALGQYENTVTEGIISAKGREITASDGVQSSETLSGLLQTDAAINPGNSGGPLVNLAGQVVGINVAIDQTGSGIGFAIPINEVKPILGSIQKYGRIVRASLGVRHIILDKAKADQLQIPVDHGALLVGNDATGEFAVIPGSAADKAGLKMKDVILSLDGKDITQDYTLQDAIRDHNPGDTVDLKVWRSGQTIDVKVTLDEAKDQAALLQTKS